MKLQKSHQVKLKLLEYCQFEKNHMLTVTEGLNNGDVVSVTKSMVLYEYEVKTSRADLRNELAAVSYAMSLEGYKDNYQSELFQKARKSNSHAKITKHVDYLFAKKYYEKQSARPAWAHTEHSLPNYFYFVVPVKLVDYALEQLANTPYGVIAHDGCRNNGQRHYIHSTNEGWPDVQTEKWGVDGGWERKFSYSCHFVYDNDDDRGCMQEVAVYKRPKKLHSEKVSVDSLKSSIKRMMTENIYNLQRLIEKEK